MAKRIDLALQEAQDAYIQAYGRVHKTPDGMFCWMGRLDRAYMVLADKQDDPQTKIKLEKMEAMIKAAYELAETTTAAYQKECKEAGISPQDIKIDCDCPCCKRQATFRFVAMMNQCKVVDGKTGGLTIDEADQFQADADKLGVKVEWVHYDLNRQEWKEGRGA